MPYPFEVAFDDISDSSQRVAISAVVQSYEQCRERDLLICLPQAVCQLAKCNVLSAPVFFAPLDRSISL